MLSRVADALYWMGRYLERSENITRLLLVTEDFSSETQGLAEQVAHSAWKDLLAIFPSAQVAPPASAFAPMSQPYLVGFFLDGANQYSVIYSLRRARENAPSVREALTVEVFLALNETYRAWRPTPGGAWPTRPRCATRSARPTRDSSPSAAPSSTPSPAMRAGCS